MGRVIFLFGAALAALTLAACDGKSSAVATRDTGGAGPMASYSGAGGQGGGMGDAGGGGQGSLSGARTRDPRDLPIPQIDGKPMWAPNRSHTAEENAEYQFSKNGGDFGAKSESDYVTKVHNFVEKPPHDAETLDRPNGDKLIYDPAGNVFAVVSKTGAPRTMFKPRDGASYWAQQKAREEKRSSGGRDGGGSDQG